MTYTGMLRIGLLLLGSIAAMSSAQCLTGNDQPETMNQNAHKDITTARFKFAMDTLSKTAQIESQDNIFYSPHSLHQALSLAYFGSRGTTESSLKAALHIPDTVSKVDLQRYYIYENSMKILREANSSSSYEYNIANRIWITNARKVRTCMLDLFSNELEQADFRANPEAVRSRVNDWVSNTTKGHIRDLIPAGGITEDSDLVLANAVYFKGLWHSRFDPANSKKDIFYASGSRSTFVTFMRQKGSFNHVVSEVLGAHVLQLPYKGDDVSMYIFLPPFATARSLSDNQTPNSQAADQARDGVRQLIERITTTKKGSDEFWELLDDGMPPREVEVSLPRFTVERDLPVGQLLHALGAGEILMPGVSNLRGFLQDGEENLHLGDAVHRARVEVTEEGTTAAAATAIFTFRSSRPAEPAVFNANHPFLYFIYDRPTKTILFSGVYRVPSTTSSDSPVSTTAPA
ncbi:serine protease inhibitor 88Ea isoform X2 [Cephus cinctus]|uniref:Serine protease inhibitor 88Ea isoform X2 n=1 Tax=Cephus cinctus TaxID=211228 RepID=A0AAJ7FEH8_CEPCN|nr:serine protease inhibitor 88Ea isoform X2 [Cephus cinctus]